MPGVLFIDPFFHHLLFFCLFPEEEISYYIKKEAENRLPAELIICFYF